VPIESYYLLNVISQEMTPSVYGEPTALRVQAIASRSYAGWFINNAPDDFDNSSARQVFIPFRFDSLNPTAEPLEPDETNPCLSTTLNELQCMVCDAVSTGDYIGLSSVDLPAFAEFSTDAYLQTVTNTDDRNGDGKPDFPYLSSVDDPISYDPAILDIIAATNAHQRGMSQGGLNRWILGNSSQYGSGTPWSVQWNGKPEYILTHYYTNIHIRNQNGERLTPEYRWVPLQIDWHTAGNDIPIMYHGNDYPVTFEVQNTGVITWIGTGQIALIYHGWELPDQQIAEVYRLLDVTRPVPPGGAITDSITLHPPTPPNPGTAYQLRFEMGLWRDPPDDWVGFGEAEPGYPWPTYDVTVCVGGPCQEQVFLPMVTCEMETAR